MERRCSGAAAADAALDGIQLRDALQRLSGDRRRAGRGEFVEAAADVRPAEGEFHVPALGERPVAGVAVDLKDALEPGQMGGRPLGFGMGA